MKKTFLFISLVSFLLTGCFSMNDEYLTNIDPLLRVELADQAEEKSEEEISFFGKVKDELTDGMKAQIEETGVNVESVIKNIFTARGTRNEIIEVAKLDFVTRLEKSVENQPYN